MIKIIAAVGKNLEIGKNNELIWHFKGDMRYFKDTTLNSTVVMGRKTYESIGKPLPNRKNIVITSKKIDGVDTVTDPTEILKMGEDVFIIGGSSIYKYFISYADILYLTEIEAEEKEADSYFPNFDKKLYIKKIIDTFNENGIDYKFTIYTKKSKKGVRI